jgi:hypothetical protein
LRQTGEARQARRIFFGRALPLQPEQPLWPSAAILSEIGAAIFSEIERKRAHVQD